MTENGTVLLSGGMHVANNTHLRDVWSSKDFGRTWEARSVAAPWPERHRHGMVFLKGCTYVFGGTTTKASAEGKIQFNYNDVWKSCDEGLSWSCVTESAQWSPREGFAFTVAEDKMLIIGGTVEDVGGAVNEVWASADGKDPRYALTAVTTPQGEVLIAGGFGARLSGGASGAMGFKDVWASPDGGRTWEQRTAKAPFGRRVYVGLGVSGAHTYIFGGQAGLGQAFRSFRDIWVTTDGSKWHKAGKMPRKMKPRGGLGVVLHADDKDGMLLLGGSSEIFPHKDFSDVWRFDPKAREEVLV
jgi:hypothetical protein